MNYEKLKKINYYIERKNTGSPKDFALKIGISQSMLFRYLSFMKSEMKAPIYFNKIRKSYEYQTLGILTMTQWKDE